MSQKRISPGAKTISDLVREASLAFREGDLGEAKVKFLEAAERSKSPTRTMELLDRAIKAARRAGEDLDPLLTLKESQRILIDNGLVFELSSAFAELHENGHKSDETHRLEHRLDTLLHKAEELIKNEQYKPAETLMLKATDLAIAAGKHAFANFILVQIIKMKEFAGDRETENGNHKTAESWYAEAAMSAAEIGDYHESKVFEYRALAAMERQGDVLLEKGKVTAAENKYNSTIEYALEICSPDSAVSPAIKAVGIRLAKAESQRSRGQTFAAKNNYEAAADLLSRYVNAQWALEAAKEIIKMFDEVGDRVAAEGKTAKAINSYYRSEEYAVHLGEFEMAKVERTKWQVLEKQLEGS